MAGKLSMAIDDGVARITLDDGKVNALSPEMIADIEQALAAAASAGAVTVLKGRAGIFSAGFDLKTFKLGLEPGVAMVRAGAELVLRVLAHPRPVITACTGHAYPAGAFLMMAADTRFGVSGAWQIGMNEVAIGLTIPRFAIELARHKLAPQGFAKLTTAAMFGPEEAMRLGYLDRVVDASELDAAVDAEVARVRMLDMTSYVATKARVNEHAITAIRTAIDEEMSSASQPRAAAGG